MLRIFLVLSLSALLAGCGGMSSTVRRPDSAVRAEQLFADGEFEAAAELFLDAAAKQRSQRDLYRLRAAEAWREQGELTQAQRILEGVGPRRLNPEQRLRLALLQAELALSANNPTQALSHLSLPVESVPPSYRGRFHFLRAQALEKNGQAFAAATEHAWLQNGLTGEERRENLRRIETLLAQVNDDALYQASEALPVGHPLYPYAGRALTARGRSLPRPYARGSQPAGESIVRAPAAADGYRPYRRVALLLPLEGNLAAAAQAVRDGFLSAYFAESRQRPEVSLYDTGEGTEGAIAAYRNALQDGAEIVIGPLARESVTALFERVEIQVPVLALNRGGEIPPPPGSVAFALAPEDEGIAAADRMLQRGWRRVIAAIGEDESAQRAFTAFRERFAQHDGVVAAEMRLPESTPDYAPLIRQALATTGTRAATLVTDSHAPTSSTVNADAIFLAARAPQARLFAPQLRVAGIYHLPVIATSQIAAGGANPRLDRELDGIEFTELPWLISDRPGLPARAPLTEKLDSARGAAARLFAFGLDACRLLGYLDHLAADPNARLLGATGDLRLDGFGLVQRAPAWARYANGHIHPAPDGALLSDGQGQQP